MKVTLVAVGTRGDVQPLVALAVGLRRAGHSPLVATTAEFKELVEEQGLDYYPLSGSPTQMMQGADMMSAMGGSGNPIVMIRGIVKTIRPQFEQGLAEVWDASQEADLIIVSMLGFYAGYHSAEKRGIPFLEGYVLPGRPTRAFPSPLMGVDLRLGGLANLLSHQIILALARQVLQPIVNQARRAALALPPISLQRLFREFDRSQQPLLYGYSSLVLPRPPDWPEWHHVTGYWFLDRPSVWQPPSELAAFLASGPPPVYIGFGSMTGRDPERITGIALEALRRTGQRGLLLTGWGGISTAGLPDGVFKIESAPHDWLFPRMAALVHHGGSGTTAAGLRAGVPSILVPFGGDQFMWGRQVSKLGVGPAAIPRKRLTVERLTDAISQAVSDAQMRERAADLGARLRAEYGVGCAVQVIEECFGSR